MADAVQRGRLARRTRVLGSENRNREVVVGGAARLGMSPPAAPNRTGPRNSKPRSWRSDPLFKRRVKNQHINTWVSPCADLAGGSATLNCSDLSSEASGSGGARPGRVSGRTSAGGGSEAPRSWIGKCGRLPWAGIRLAGRQPNAAVGPPGRSGAGRGSHFLALAGAGSASGDSTGARPTAGQRSRKFLRLGLLGQ